MTLQCLKIPFARGLQITATFFLLSSTNVLLLCVPAQSDRAAAVGDGVLLLAAEEHLAGTEINSESSNSFSRSLDSSAACSEVTVRVNSPITSPIPVPNPGTVTNGITIAAGMFTTIKKLKVYVDITHQWIADIEVTLTKASSPSPKQIRLFGDDVADALFIPCRDAQFLQVTFADDAAQSIPPDYNDCDGTNDVKGEYKPTVVTDFDEASIQSLAIFEGIDVAGTWTLTVTDEDLVSTGNLNGWSLLITTCNFVSTPQPSRLPSAQPSQRPSAQPSKFPSAPPSQRPSAQPSQRPSAQPSQRPSAQPSRRPSAAPSTRACAAKCCEHPCGKDKFYVCRNGKKKVQTVCTKKKGKKSGDRCGPCY